MTPKAWETKEKLVNLTSSIFETFVLQSEAHTHKKWKHSRILAWRIPFTEKPGGL